MRPLLLLVLAVSAVADCAARTPVFVAHGASNANSYYFVARSYMAGFTGGTCISVPTNEEFRGILVINLACEGEWCREGARWPGGWNCPNQTADCYQVERIIAKANTLPGLEGCNTNVLGNLVMAYSRWNSQLGAGFEHEKLEIYEVIYEMAYAAVARCCAKPRHPPGLSPCGAVSALVPLYSAAAFIIIGIMVLICRQHYLAGQAETPPHEILDRKELEAEPEDA